MTSPIPYKLVQNIAGASGIIYRCTIQRENLKHPIKVGQILTEQTAYSISLRTFDVAHPQSTNCMHLKKLKIKKLFASCISISSKNLFHFVGLTKAYKTKEKLELKEFVLPLQV